jgi:hypothetical protein
MLRRQAMLVAVPISAVMPALAGHDGLVAKQDVDGWDKTAMTHHIELLNSS